MPRPRFTTDRITLGYGDRPVLETLSLELPADRVTAIIGPNGCGKSTLLRSLGRLLTPSSGQVLLDGAPIAGLRPRDLARRVAVLPQSPSAPPGLTVLELVARGRTPHQHWYDRFSREDERIVDEMLSATGMTAYADAEIDALSGGQRQRAWISMTLAQQAETLLLDEPTTYLDVGHQLEVLELVRRLNREHGRTVIMVLHDISLAARYADHIVVLHDGRVEVEGAPDDVITPSVLRRVFGIRAGILDESHGYGRHVLPLGLPSTTGVAIAAEPERAH